MLCQHPSKMASTNMVSLEGCTGKIVVHIGQGKSESKAATLGAW